MLPFNPEQEITDIEGPCPQLVLDVSIKMAVANGGKKEAKLLGSSRMGQEEEIEILRRER